MLIAVQVKVFDVPSTCIFKGGHFSMYGEIRGFVKTVIQRQRPVVVSIFSRALLNSFRFELVLGLCSGRTLKPRDFNMLPEMA